MSKTIEFVEKEIENTKKRLERLEIDLNFPFRKDVIVHFKEELKTLEQIKCELEAWEVVKPAISEEHLEDCQIRTMFGENLFMNVSKEEATKVKKALEVEFEK